MAIPTAAGDREASLGITEFLTPGPGFLAITKLRFTDFIVHEVSLSGQTVRLEALEDAPAAPAPADSAPGAGAPHAPADVAAEAALADVVGLEVAQALCQLQASAKAAGGAAQSEPVLLPRDDDKAHRKAVHQLVKQHLLPLVSDTADADGGGKCVRVQAPAAARAANRAGGKRQRVDNREEWPVEAGGKRYLSFTLYKENRDTLQAVQELARLLRVGQNLFGFAGTKERHHGQSAYPGSMVPELGSSSCSGRAWRLWAARHSQGRGQATRTPAMASAARASRLQSRAFHRV